MGCYGSRKYEQGGLKHQPGRIQLIGLNMMLLYGALAVYLGGLIQGLTGFGFSMVTVPLLVIFISPKMVVPAVLILSLVVNMVLFLKLREWVDLRRIRSLIIFGIAGMPVGVFLLVVLDAGLLKILIGSVILLFAIAFLMGLRREIQNEQYGFAAVGVVSGLLNGSIKMAGPPVILFLTNQGLAKQPFRASLVSYFLFVNLATVPVFCLGGVMTVSVARYAILLIPVLIAGVLTGNQLARVVAEERFRVIALIIVVAAALLSILSGVGLI